MTTSDQDAMTIYVIGPGYGESQVVVFPSGRCLVVDCCVSGGQNLTLQLLRTLRVRAVDLLVVTHPDLDHIRSLRTLVDAFRPVEAWRYPFGLLRELVSHWCRLNPEDRRLREVSDAYDVLDELEEHNVASEPTLGTGTLWRCDVSGAEVRCIAPTQSDALHARKQLDRLVEYETTSRRRERPGDEPTLGLPIQDYLLGERRSLGDHPNTISMGVSIRWRQRRVLLAGDVENGRANSTSGWKGILEALRQRGLLDCVSELDLVKVAHHGSPGAFHPPAWDIHRRTDGSTIATITPFDRGRYPLPHPDTLTNVRGYANLLGITADVRGVFTDAQANGWVREPALDPQDASLAGPILKIVLPDTGPGRLSDSSVSGRFRVPPPSSSSSSLPQAPPPQGQPPM